jgi:type II secretory pathway component PulF
MAVDARLPDALAAETLARLSRALAAGIDARRAWAGETARMPQRWRAALAAGGRVLDAGGSLAEAARATGVFGPVVTGLIEVGDRTGRDAEVLADVAAALADSVRQRRELAAGLVRPAVQLVVALVAIGVLIAVAGSITDLDGRPTDVSGLGLRGAAGLRVYLAAVAVAAVAGGVALAWGRRSWRDGGRCRRLARRLPIIGPALEAADAAAWCRGAALADASGLDAGGLVTVASQAAPALALPVEAVVDRLRHGADLAEALAAGARGRLPRRVLEAVAVGQLTGTTAETLERLAGQLAAEARAAFTSAVRAAGMLAWAVVTAASTIVIVRFFAAYANLIQDAARGG